MAACGGLSLDTVRQYHVLRLQLTVGSPVSFGYRQLRNVSSALHAVTQSPSRYPISGRLRMLSGCEQARSWAIIQTGSLKMDSWSCLLG